MTTIATDGKTMAGDGLTVNGRDIVVGTSRQKVFRLDNGGIYGACGNAREVIDLMEWLNGRREKEPDLKDISALVIRPDGSLVIYNDSVTCISAEAPTAIGTGSQVAMGAMAAGASPVEAVRLACERDVFSGGEITVLELHPIAKLEAA